jgi:hypothetical protein
MTITILNGNMQTGENGFDSFLQNFEILLKKNHDVNHFKLNQMDIRQCNGCWDCWWKTPGICSIKDDMPRIFSAAMKSDILIFASPLMVGFTSSLLKKMTDRFVSLIHPYVILNEGECHHRKRYEKYPDFGLLVEKEHDTDDDDMAIVKDIYDRFALNFHCKLRFFHTTDIDKPQDIAYEIDNI